MDNKFAPQLSMVYPDLNNLSPLELPAGFSARTFRDGDDGAWESIVREAFESAEISYALFKDDPEYRSDKVWFICDGDFPVATATAWY